MANRLLIRLEYLIERARVLDLPSVVERAKAVEKQHGKAWPVVFADMLKEAGLHGTGFQDYVDFDFALLNNRERRTYMTQAIANSVIMQVNDPEYFDYFENKVMFNKIFADYIDREWFVVTEHTTDELKDFMQRQGRVIAKVPVSNSGYGVSRYEASEVKDWEEFRKLLIHRDQILLEEYIVQHDALMKVSPGVVNTTRVATYWDGEKAHIVCFAQKFGVGDQASDQMSFGGVMTLLDQNGKATSAGYGSHQKVYANHPETGESIEHFQLPFVEETYQLAAEVAKEIPQVPFVAWDFVITPNGPTLVEGNRSPGMYENKVSVTGRRTGHKAQYKQAIGFEY